MAKTTKTGPQIHAYGTSAPITTTDGDIGNPNLPSGWHTKVRKMRKDPTLALARQLLFAPILAADWSYESDNDVSEEIVEFISNNMNDLKFDLVRTTLMGTVDFGWQSYEKVFVVDENRVKLKKLKPLLQEITTIRINDATGAYRGLKQDEVILEREETLLVSSDVEGTDWYGQALMLNAEDPYDNWIKADEAACRFDTKVAGTHWIVKYPMGKSRYDGKDDVDNGDIARQILQALESSGRVAIPKNIEDWMANEGSANPGWEIELMSATGQGSFIERLRYLDVLKVRALGFPERSILEGEFGTKAEAAEHGDFAITNLELRHLSYTHFYNRHCVNHLLRLNFGDGLKNKVKIVPAPIADHTRSYLQTIYASILSDPNNFLAELAAIDMVALRSKVGVPSDGASDDEDVLRRLISETAGRLQ